MLILVTAQLSVSVSFVNTQIGHCLTRMERVTNIEQDKVNKESSSRNGISAPIIWSPVWGLSLLSVVVSVLSRSSLLLLSKRETLLVVQGHTICLTLLWMRCLSCPRQRRETLRSETKDNSGYADWLWKEIETDILQLTITQLNYKYQCSVVTRHYKDHLKA